MFDKLMREVERLGRGIKLPISLPIDEEGFFDRQCPAANCQAEFKVLFEDWKAKVRDEEVFCPLCRVKAPADKWNTADQSRYIKGKAFAYVKETFDRALASDARRFNSRPKRGFLQLSLSVKPSTPPVILPIAAADAMRQKFTCKACGCRYASIGAAFFCLACGHNSVLSTFDQTIETVRKTMAGLPDIRAVLVASFDENTAQNTLRDTIENNMSRLVGAFEHLAKALYEKLPATTKLPRKNVFQNLADGSTLWRNSTGKGYEHFLSCAELDDLTRLFRQRHVLTHCQGIVDREYLNQTGDQTYAVGRRLVIRDADVLRLADLVTKLSSGLRGIVP